MAAHPRRDTAALESHGRPVQPARPRRAPSRLARARRRARGDPSPRRARRQCRVWRPRRRRTARARRPRGRSPPAGVQTPAAQSAAAAILATTPAASESLVHERRWTYVVVLRIRSGVVSVHCGLRAGGEPAQRGIGRTLDGLIQRDALIALWPAQQEVHILLTPLSRAADADPDAGELVDAEVANDGLYAMLAAGRAGRAQPHLAKWQRD